MEWREGAKRPRVLTTQQPDTQSDRLSSGFAFENRLGGVTPRFKVTHLRSRKV